MQLANDRVQRPIVGILPLLSLGLRQYHMQGLPEFWNVAKPKVHQCSSAKFRPHPLDAKRIEYLPSKKIDASSRGTMWSIGRPSLSEPATLGMWFQLEVCDDLVGGHHFRMEHPA